MVPIHILSNIKLKTLELDKLYSIQKFEAKNNVIRFPSFSYQILTA